MSFVFHREKEELKLKMLEEEYKRRDAHREQLVKQKVIGTCMCVLVTI